MMTDQKENEGKRKMKETKTYVVVAGLWYDKTNGNTYYNAHIMDATNAEHHYTGVAYGYERQYYFDSKEYIINKLGCLDGTFVLLDMGSFHINKKDLRNNNF